MTSSSPSAPPGPEAGILALVGGAEFQPGNEEHDRRLCEAAGGEPIFVIPTAAARQAPAKAVATAREWFHSLGTDVEELPVLTRRDASSAKNAELAATARAFYLAGGDPGLVVNVLKDSPVWDAIVQAWRRGAALAGSSAGAMALCTWSLIRNVKPGGHARRALDALGLVPNSVFLPHYNTFGKNWTRMAWEETPDNTIMIGVDERSAAIWDGRHWTAYGEGEVILVADDDVTRFRSGEGGIGIPAPRAP
jgi:cyanophycinase